MPRQKLEQKQITVTYRSHSDVTAHNIHSYGQPSPSEDKHETCAGMVQLQQSRSMLKSWTAAPQSAFQRDQFHPCDFEVIHAKDVRGREVTTLSTYQHLAITLRFLYKKILPQLKVSHYHLLMLVPQAMGCCRDAQLQHGFLGYSAWWSQL